MGQSKVTPVEMEIAKSAKQESYGFSHEKFNSNFDGQKTLINKGLKDQNSRK